MAQRENPYTDNTYFRCTIITYRKISSQKSTLCFRVPNTERFVFISDFLLSSSVRIIAFRLRESVILQAQHGQIVELRRVARKAFDLALDKLQ